MTEWYRLSADEALDQAQSDLRGLSGAEAARRLAEHGPNELIEAGTKSPWRILAEQFTSLLIIILIIAAVVSAVLGDYEDAIVIMAIVVLNGILGFRQEYKAEKTMSALRKMAAPIVRVRRDGEVREVAAADLVPGDIVLIEAGNVIPADARLIQSASLRVQEAALTGESEPVEKTVDRLPESDVALGDRVNMIFMGTSASYGRGEGVVSATGMQTELGKIAGMVQGVEQSKTPLQKRLAQLGRWLAVAALMLVIIIFVTGLLRGEPLELMFLTAVSMAVAAVPEGLPAIVTVALSLGAQRMLKRNALIRKLPAVETLGSVTVICSDKTGTLTENRMTVVILDVAGHEVDLQEEMRRGRVAPLPCAATGDNASLIEGRPAVALLVAGGVLCNDSVLQTVASEEDCDWTPAGEPAPSPRAATSAEAATSGEGPATGREATPSYEAATSRFRALGDPTESALVIAGVHLGLVKTDLEAAFPRTGEIPFDSDRKLMTTTHGVSGAWAEAAAGPRRVRDLGVTPDLIATRAAALPPGLEALHAFLADNGTSEVSFTKGAPEALLPLATAFWDGERAVPLDASTRAGVVARNRHLASQGMRVLAVGFRALGPKTGATVAAAPDAATSDSLVLEQDLVLVGLIGMIDPARAEAREAVLTAVAAGIRPVMITGDQPLTAAAIARQVGILGEEAPAAGGGPGARLPVLTGPQLASLSPEELEHEVDRIAVYARVAPEQKLTIVQALQEHGHIVAMTGDGVNDAPALQKADIGVAMGITGTDVAKEAADMVLLDDNFATIVAAVKEGRAIYDNIRKFIKYLMATNVGELTVMLFAPLSGMPLPLLPLQILWMNLVTDGLPGLALGFEPAEPNVMQRPPHPPSESIFARGLGTHIVWAGPFMGVIALFTGWVYWQAGDDAWQTMLFTVLTLSQMAHVLAIHQERRSLFGSGFLTNPLLLWAVLVTVLLQFALLYVPFLQQVFGTQALDLTHILVASALSTVIFWVIETQKLVWRMRERGQ